MSANVKFRKKERKKEDGQLKLISALPPNSLTSPATSLDFLSSIPSFFWKTLLHAIQEYIHVNGTANSLSGDLKAALFPTLTVLGRREAMDDELSLEESFTNIGLIACPMH
jgi:hypothetical protein